MTDPDELGDRLRRDRVAAGLTQEELAVRSGLSIRSISDLERGRTSRPRLSTVRQVSDALRLAAQEAGGPPTGSGAALRRPLAQLPRDIRDFTGRGAQVEMLTDLLTADGDMAGGDGPARGAVVISAVVGAAGIGKSALAVHAAHLLAPRFPDGQLYLNLRGSSSQAMAPGAALIRLLRDLEADPTPAPADEGERAARYRSLVAGRRLLILLDDVRDATQIRALLPGTDGCAVLITSRNSLPDLESARPMELDILAEPDALDLFARIVGQVRAAAEPDAVRAVLAACGGRPLAIRIAAGRQAARPRWSVTTLATRLGHARSRLDELQAGDLAVRASFTVSYEHARAQAGRVQVPPDRAFCLLGLTDGADLSLSAAAALIGVPQDQAGTALELLVDAHLLHSDAPGRYRFHDLLRVYAADQAEAELDSAERAAALRRMLSWYLHSAVAAARQINPIRTHVRPGPVEAGTAPLAFSSYVQALDWLDAEHANLVAAVGQAARQGEHVIAWMLPIALWELFSLRGHWDDWLATHQTGMTSARLLYDSAAEVWLLNHLSSAYQLSGYPLAAVDCLNQTLPYHRANGNKQALAKAQVNLGLALIKLRRPDEAERSLRDSLRIFRDMGDRNGEGMTLASIGEVCQLRGQLTEAIVQYQQALAALREAKNVVAEGEVMLEIGNARLKLGQPEAALRESMSAAHLIRRTGNRYGEAQAVATLGQAQHDLGHLELARTHWLDAAAIFTEIGHPQAAEVNAKLSALAAR